jgi:hypothetical protein
MGERHEVGARQRPNTDAKRHLRASVSSSARNGDGPGRLASDGAIEALLDSDDRTCQEAPWQPERTRGTVRKPRF